MARYWNAADRQQARELGAGINKFAESNRLRPTWHMPGKRGVKATVVGTHLNNRLGTNILAPGNDALQEYVIRLEGPEGTLKVNLADLFAAAEVLYADRLKHVQALRMLRDWAKSTGAPEDLLAYVNRALAE